MIKSPEDLDKVLKILRANGVFEFELSGLKAKLGDLPNETPQLADAVSAQPLPLEAEMDLMVGMPIQGLDDPFINYSVAPEPMVPDEDTEA